MRGQIIERSVKMSAEKWTVVYENKKTKLIKKETVQAETAQGASMAAKLSAGKNWKVKSVTPA